MIDPTRLNRTFRDGVLAVAFAAGAVALHAVAEQGAPLFYVPAFCCNGLTGWFGVSALMHWFKP